jgi:hypothetical protein
MYMDSSYLASITVNKLRRVRIFGFLVETLSPNPQCMRTLIPIWAVASSGHITEQVLLRRISLSDSGLLAELFHYLLCFLHLCRQHFNSMYFAVLGSFG